jgi:uncharacterized protein (TIGR00255 family)
MIRSMTGFARADAAEPAGRLAWEIRSVNHRYLEIQLRLPEGFRSIEADVRQRIGQGVRRGKVDAALGFRPAAVGPANAALNSERAAQLVAFAEQVAGMIAHPGPVSPTDILRLPGVLEESETLVETLFPGALACLDEAMGSLTAARGREGARITEMLAGRCRETVERVERIRARLPQVLADINARLTERLRAVAVNAEPGRVEQELALIAQKLDVSEELDRLQAHCAEFVDTLSAPEPAGRRLDFLLQEFNREANTLASKSADAQTSRDAVDLKVIIEQMREQVQNVE